MDKTFFLSLLYQLVAPRSARPELIRDLGEESKTLKDLSSAFVERADQIPCIISFYETNKLHGQIVSVCHYRMHNYHLQNFHLSIHALAPSIANLLVNCLSCWPSLAVS